MGFSLKIAICGTRGIPACYGGFETFAEELSTRLVRLGHQVAVYGRSHVIDYPHSSYQGVDIRLLPAPRHKYLETPVHCAYSLIDVVRRGADVVLVCNAANSPFVWIPRLFRMPVIVNVDGIERLRQKWSLVGKLWYRFGEISSVLFASHLVSDADVIEDYYRRVYHRSSSVIRYGYRAASEEWLQAKVSGTSSFPLTEHDRELFVSLGIEPGKYILFVSRLEPENNAHLVISAYQQLPAVLRTMPLVIVGDAPYAKQYISRIREMAGSGVILAGARYGVDYERLQLAAFIYVQATEVGGTHPALVEAMGYANAIVANDTPEHREVIQDTGVFYQKNDSGALSARLSELLSEPHKVIDLRRRARQRAIREFNWDKIVSDYQALFFSLLSRSS